MATESEAPLTIGQVAQRAGIRVSHIRYYEEVGVLPEAERVSGQRRYGEDVLHRLSIIDVAQRAGLTLDEIRYLTGPDNCGGDASVRIRELAERKLPDLDALIERARAVRRWLEIAQGCDCASVDVCALFIDPTIAPPPGDPKPSVPQVGVPSGDGVPRAILPGSVMVAPRLVVATWTPPGARTLVNSRKLRAILRHAGPPAIPQISLQNGHI
jgi:MerR family transcriptional regulator, redox-sensitive transcriptional activator SoxR